MLSRDIKLEHWPERSGIKKLKHYLNGIDN